MKKMLLACALLASAALAAGTWTEDFEAARRLSKERNLPLLLDFTGSDWCFWCKLMDRQVFAEKAWDDWARTNVVCVTVDFPRAASKVAPKTRAQNEKLLARFGVKGFPTFVLLAPGGEAELGRAHCPGRGVTPAQFIAEVRKTLGKPPAAAKK